MAAKRRGKTWRRDPRNVVARLIAENPKAGKKKWKEAFRIAIRGKDGGDALDSVADYWFETYWEGRLKDDQA